MLERKKLIDVLTGVMAVAMVVITIFVSKQKFSVTPSQNLPQPVEVFTNATVGSTTIRAFKNEAEMEAFLKSDDPKARILRAFMTSTSATSTSFQ